MRILIVVGVIALAFVAVGAGYFNMTAQWDENPTGMAGMPGMASPVAAMGDPVAGEAIYQESCAACHGDNLQGQLDWQSPGEDGRLPAPPHDKTGHTWHHGDQLLFSYTKLGGKMALAQQGIDFNSGMPEFGDQLSDSQIWDILAYIKSTWPERQRQVQDERSKAERLEEEDS